MKLPEDVEKIINNLNTYGYEAYAVGGCVRDSLMGRKPLDWDITTSAAPLEVKKIFPHTFDTGIAHGTVTVVLHHVNYEVTTYRIDGKYGDCRHPQEVIFTRDLTEDLLRRDFTMNAIAYHPKEGFVDPFYGRMDIDKKMIRGVGAAKERFEEDALRMLRAVRFAVQLGFDIEADTLMALKEKADLLKFISAERIREELSKLLIGEYMEKMPLLWQTGILKVLFGKFEEKLIECGKDVYSFQISPKRLDIRWAIFLRNLNEKELKTVLEDLKFDTKMKKRIQCLVENKGLTLSLDRYRIKKQIYTLGEENFRALLFMRQCIDRNSSAENVMRMMEDILDKKEPIFIKELCISGNDLMKAGVKQGKEIGVFLDRLLDAVHRQPNKNSREELLEKVKEWVKIDKGNAE